MAKKDSKKAASNATETKAEKFKRLGEMRATKAVNAMRGLQKLSNRNSYEYTDVQVNKIVSILKAEVEGIHAAFTRKSGDKPAGVTL